MFHHWKDFRGQLKLKHYFLGAFILLFVAVAFPCCSQFKDDHINTLRYFYSSIAQSIAAIIAIGTVFAIFGFERIDENITSLSGAFKEFIRRRIYDADKQKEDKKKREVDEWLDKDVLHMLLACFEKVKDEDKRNKTDTLQPGFVDYYLEFENLQKFKSQLKAEIWRTTASLIMTFFLSLLLLINVERIQLQTFFIFTNFIIGIAILISLWFTVQYIAIVSEGPRKDFINNPLINSISDDVSGKREEKIRKVEAEMMQRIEVEKQIWKNRFLS